MIKPHNILLFPVPFWIDLMLLILSTFLFIETRDYPQMSGVFPRLVLIMIFVVALMDMSVTIRKQLRERTDKEVSEAGKVAHTKQKLKVFYMALLMFLFFFFMVLFGVILGTLFFTFISGWTLGYRKIKTLIISSVIITISVHVIFIVIMKSFLPEGLIFSIIGG